jgi:hypothetical protein
MPPRPVTLAAAGRKLTGEAEGYSRKKELAIKRWLTALPAAAQALPEDHGPVAEQPQASRCTYPGCIVASGMWLAHVVHRACVHVCNFRCPIRCLQWRVPA